jgi:uncharacterized protein YggE
MKRFNSIVLIMACILAGTITLTSCSSMAGMKNSKTVRTVSVTGNGSVNLTPDMASFNVQVSETRDTTSEALNAMNEKTSTIFDILDAYNIENKDRKTNSINLRTDYDWVDSKQVVVGQVASQSINVKLRDLDQLGSIIDKLSTVNEINLGSINYNTEDTDEAETEARIMAVEDAREKAQSIADAENMTLGLPISINNSSSDLNIRNYPNMMEAVSLKSVSTSVSTQAPTGEITITGQVNIVYELIAK